MRYISLLCLAASSFGASLPAAEAPAAPADAWFRDARFGLFIHWGPVSLVGTEIGWSRGGERRGTGGTGEIPLDVYDNLYKKFDPVKFDAAEWVSIAKAAGMKYLVFTTRHHDGFSMFDSKLTDYKITRSPFGRDVTAELAKACHDAGLPLGFYHSPPDWHHPDYRTANHARFIQFLHGQVEELCRNYGKVSILWFDGLGGTAKDWDAEKLLPRIRELQPGILINNRAGLPADFDTPEQEVGRFQRDRAWESCITIGDQWAWKPKDRVKSLEECLRLLVRCACGDGNLLFNVGPMPTGEIEPRQVARLKEMGAWLSKTGESIYATRGGPIRPAGWGGTTYRGNKVYVHVLAWEGDSLRLPSLPKKIVASSVLGGGAAKVVAGEEGLEIVVAPADRKPIDTIVVLELDGPASEIAPLSFASASVAAGKKATASNVHQGSAAYGPDKALDDDDGTRWATDGGTHAAWLEVDLGAEMAVERAAISEAFERVQRFELRGREKDGDPWKPFAAGTKIGKQLEMKFPAARVRHVRLEILEATEGPTIWEFRLYPPKK